MDPCLCRISKIIRHPNQYASPQARTNLSQKSDSFINASKIHLTKNNPRGFPSCLGLFPVTLSYPQLPLDQPFTFPLTLPLTKYLNRVREYSAHILKVIWQEYEDVSKIPLLLLVLAYRTIHITTPRSLSHSHSHPNPQILYIVNSEQNL